MNTNNNQTTQRPVILDVRHLKSYFHTGKALARAVDDVSFQIHAGETLAIVGESGSGKSVTALSILQLLAQPAGFIAGGEIFFHDTNLCKLKPDEMRQIRGNRISMIFQEPMTALNPVFTVGYQLGEVMKLHQHLSGETLRARCIEMLDKVGIPAAETRLEDYPHQLSGGMRQRVMIAMALACKPELLIADEPTTALDVTVQAQIMDLIRELQHDLGTAVLLITHNMGLVQENADSVCVMYAGKIVEKATKQEIFAAPRHPYTQLLLQSLPNGQRRDLRLAAIDGMAPRATDFPDGCRFSGRCPFAQKICAEKLPVFTQFENDHCAACLRFEAQTASNWDDSKWSVPAPDAAPQSARDDSVTRLEVTDLKTYFPIRRGILKRIVGYVRAVDGVNLTLNKGETVAIVGESGCGKTTVGKSLIRLIDPCGGSAMYNNTYDLAAMTQREFKPLRSKIQMIFQDPFSSLNPRLMVGEIIREGMTAQGIGANEADRDEKIIALMKRVGLDASMMNRYPHQFSGGQRQRIGLARALAVNPELIICDESTSALDVSVQAQILNLFKDLQSEFGLSYIFITHDLSVVEYLADRVCVMYLGRMVESGTNDDIFNHSRHPYTRALLSAVPQIDPATQTKKIRLQGDVPSPINPPKGCHFHPRCPYATEQCKCDYPPISSANSHHRFRCFNPPDNLL